MRRALYISIAAILIAGSGLVYQNAFRGTGEAATGATFSWRATGSGPVNETLTRGQRWMIDEIHFTCPGADGAGLNFTVRQDSQAGSAYDTLFLTQDMAAVSDSFVDQGWYRLSANDAALFTWANTQSLSWGLEVYGETAF
jgi:hypothetical protein